MKRIGADVAMACWRSGLSVLPAIRGKKRPEVGRWREYMKRLPEEIEIDAWFANHHDAMCIVCGKVSGNLECIDFDAHGECLAAWKGKVEAALLDRLVIERSPSGGYHVLYRSSEPVEGNLKLARGMREGKLTTLIETRGEGGVFLCSPTEGYELKQGDFAHLATISPVERKALLDAARSFDEGETAVSRPVSPGADVGQTDGFLLRPGDDFSARGDIRPYLQANGWQSAGMSHDGNELWTRPGKDVREGNSATWKNRVFYVFTSSASPFEPNKGYSAFQVYAKLEHDGDFSAAANALLKKGFGKVADPMRGVDLSGFNPAVGGEKGTVRDAPPETRSEYEDPGVVPHELFDVPGFVSDYMEHILRVSPYPNRPMAFCAALAMLSHLAGRRFKSVHGTRLNIYLLGLGNSGVGKERPRICNIDLAAESGFGNEIGDSFASGEGLEDSLAFHPAMLYQVDEVDNLFNIVKLKDARAAQINAMLLKFFSESGTFHRMRAKAYDSRNVNPVSVICEPHLVLLGTATPRFFYQSMTERSLENGLLARCLVVELGERGMMNDVFEEDIPPGILDFVRRVREPAEGGNVAGLAAGSSTLRPVLKVIGESEEARRRLNEYRQEADVKYSEAESKSKFDAMALWARAGEKVAKLSCLHALSEDPENPSVTVEGVEWAGRLVDHLTRRMLYMTSLYVFDGEFDERVKKFMRILADKHNRASRSVLLKNTHLDAKDFDSLVKTLQQTGQIRSEITPSGGEVFSLV